MTKVLLNKSKRTYIHSLINNNETNIFEIKAGEKKEVPDEIANIWLKSPEIIDVSNDENLKGTISEQQKKIEELQATINAQKESGEMEVLHAKAKSLGIKGYEKMKKEKLEDAIAQRLAKETEKKAE